MGLWGAVLGLLFGSTGFLLNHRGGPLRISPGEPQVSQIQMRLQKDPALKDNRIEVTVNKGIATLKGMVDTDAEKAEASRLASVSGIVGTSALVSVLVMGAFTLLAWVRLMDCPNAG